MTLTNVQEIAFFSYDDAHVFYLDDRSLRYYYPPRLGADLSKGFDKFQQLDDTADDHLDSLLSTIIALEKKSGVKCEADIITWRGMMTKVSKRCQPVIVRILKMLILYLQIMATPYDNMNGYGLFLAPNFGEMFDADVLSVSR